MRFQIFSDDMMIGSSDLDNLDPSMGIASGLFLPSENYWSVQAVFRLYARAGISAAGQDADMVDRYYQERDDLNLTLRLISREVVPVQCVHIEDYLEELNEIAVAIAVFDSQTFDQHFEADRPEN